MKWLPSYGLQDGRWPELNSWPDDVRFHFEELAAYFEYESGYDVNDAERKAFMLIKRKLGTLPNYYPASIAFREC